MNCLISDNGMDLFNLPITELYLLLDVRSKEKYESSHVAGSYSISIDNIETIEERLKEIVMEIDSSQMKKICIIDDIKSNIILSSNLLFNYIQENGLPDAFNNDNRKKPNLLLLLQSFDSFASMYPFLLSNGVEPYDEKSIVIETMNTCSPIFFPSQIENWGLYLGNKQHASDIRVIETLGITTIINVTVEIPNYFENSRNDVEYCKLDVEDDEDTEMLCTWIKVAEKIESCKKINKKVLVHCSAGRSRSASSIIYYLIKKQDNCLSLDAAYKHVLRCRDCIDPNPGFRKQLKQVAEN